MLLENGANLKGCKEEAGESSGRNWKAHRALQGSSGHALSMDVPSPPAVLCLSAACVDSECLPFARPCITSNRGDIVQTQDSLVIAQLLFPWRCD